MGGFLCLSDRRVFLLQKEIDKWDVDDADSSHYHSNNNFIKTINLSRAILCEKCNAAIKSNRETSFVFQFHSYPFKGSGIQITGNSTNGTRAFELGIKH